MRIVDLIMNISGWPSNGTEMSLKRSPSIAAVAVATSLAYVVPVSTASAVLTNRSGAVNMGNYTRGRCLSGTSGLQRARQYCSTSGGGTYQFGSWTTAHGWSTTPTCGWTISLRAQEFTD